MAFNPFRSFLLLSICSLFALTACDKAEKAPVTSAKPVVEVESLPTWEKFVTVQIEDHVDAHPQFAVVQGRHEYDGQLPDWSRAGIEKEVERLHKARKEAMAFTDDQMTAEQI